MTIKEMDELAASQAGAFVAKTATPNPIRQFMSRKLY
jgi:dihydroorotate dehydrogenase (fumarate)